MFAQNGLSILVGGVLLVSFLFVFLGIRYIPNDRIGVVEKRWSFRGSVKSGFIALTGEAGFQPEVLRGGVHFLMPFQYSVHKMPLVTIPQGRIGYVFARDGHPMAPTQTLAASTTSKQFQDVRQFLASGGQRGPQRQILREGTYAINLAQFLVVTEGKLFYLGMSREEDGVFRQMAQTIAERGGFTPVVIKGSDDAVGVVTVHDGPSLPQGELIAPVVGDSKTDLRTYHNNFQDPEAFLAAGGLRGRQLQVLVEGTYYVNRLFATVELIAKTVVEVGHVGVVVSYTGNHGKDVSGVEYKHGELVAPGERGVWSEPLLPGKYAFNTYAGKVIMVPTTNFILKWTRGEIGAHRFDENLAEVSLITKDAFEPSLPLSVVVHIDYRKAPLVVQRFGDVKRLVEQTLDPMVAAYFKNIGQTRTLIQLIQDRSIIQALASEEMKARFSHYNLELEEVLIGTPAAANGDKHIATILEQLRSRQIAEEQIETYARQEKAAGKERELREAVARADRQKHLTESELAIQIEANQGRASYERSVQQAAQMRTMADAEAAQMRMLAEAEAARVRMLGEAEADKAARVGIAEAVAIEEQVRAYGGPKFQVTQHVMKNFADAIATSKVDIVPRIVMGGGANGSAGGANGSVMETLLAMLLSDKLGEGSAVSDKSKSPELEALRSKIKSELMATSATIGVSGANGTNGNAATLKVTTLPKS
ncbi:MAG: flotillin family protein [Deltaproteobacteria bacterium]|nr:flotillin family protein [Deltaproteobacteria bacterium]